MRGLLVNNEDLLRTNAQLNNEMKRLREQMIEIDRERQVRDEKIREMEVRTCKSATVRHPKRRGSNLGLCVCATQMEVKEARNMMVEANSQEYAFNFLQQSLKNRIQDAEVCEQTNTSSTDFNHLI